MASPSWRAISMVVCSGLIAASEGPSGCKALSVDAGLVYVLGGLEGSGAEGGTIYRLDAKDGKLVPWPNGAIDLKIFSLWPRDGATKPDTAPMRWRCATGTSI